MNKWIISIFLNNIKWIRQSFISPLKKDPILNNITIKFHDKKKNWNKEVKSSIAFEQKENRFWRKMIKYLHYKSSNKKNIMHYNPKNLHYFKIL